jgi:HD-GYP domain-containing protein (c-di-GMP phosphodiesterase class II)
MAIAVNMGYDKQTLMELGIGCLVQDVGMLMVDRRAYDSNRILTPDEFAEVTKHPVLTFEVLNKLMDWVPVSSRMVAYQVHERCDGSGYPRGRQATQIHELAKIAAVADVFVALLSSRPHRSPMIPYYAVEKIVFDAKNGLFDPDVVRALLKTVSLFPIGSWIELSDGRVGQVIRSSGDHWARPVVEVWNLPQADGGREVVNLAGPEPVKIVCPAVPPAETD